MGFSPLWPRRRHDSRLKAIVPAPQPKDKANASYYLLC
jgi:hypothetical protein